MRENSKSAQPLNDRRRHALKCARPAAALRAASNRRRAMRLRLKGQTFQRIGQALGVSASTAHGYVNDAWDRLNAQTDRLRRQLRAQELAEMDARLKVLMPVATRDNLRPADPAQGPGGPMVINRTDFDAQMEAVDEVLRIIDRQCLLLGLYATPPDDAVPDTVLPDLSLPES